MPFSDWVESNSLLERTRYRKFNIALEVDTSNPLQFAVSQSWGWKSSSLDVGELGDEQDTQESSLRATVVIGLV